MTNLTTILAVIGGGACAASMAYLLYSAYMYLYRLVSLIENHESDFRLLRRWEFPSLVAQVKELQNKERKRASSLPKRERGNV